MRADVFLVEQGLASTRSQAQRLIASGVEWRVGDPAPNFSLPTQLGKTVTLSDLRGRNVVLAFFPLAWTPI